MSFVRLSLLAGLLCLHAIHPESARAQSKPEAFTYPVVLFSPYPEVSIAPVIKQGLKPSVIQKLPPERYQLIVLAEANSVAQASDTARICSVTLGIAKKIKSDYHVPNVRFNAMGYSTSPSTVEDSQKWEQNCIESALGKALADLSQSDLDYVKFMADR